MRKKLLVVTLVLMSVMMMGCNREIIDTTYRYDKAIIVIGDKSIEVEIAKWGDYDDTSVQITAKDGQVYLTDIKNVLLIKE